MESLTGRAAPDLIETLEKTAGSFNFFQAVSLCEEYLRTQGKSDPCNDGSIRFYADPSLVFPPADITAIRRRDSGVDFILAVMGLVGASAPLPVYFTEYLVKYPDRAGALADFLAIFNHRFYVFFYNAWKKYRLLQAFGAPHKNPLGSMLMRLAGVTDPECRMSPTRKRTLAYGGMLVANSRSAAALAGMIADFFQGIPCTVRENTGRWTTIPDPCRLGFSAQLGVTAIAGTRVWDVAGKFTLRLGPLPRQEFERFLPGCPAIAAIRELVGDFLIDPLEYDIEVVLAGNDLTPVILGAQTARLGETSSLGKSAQTSRGHTIVINCN